MKIDKAEHQKHIIVCITGITFGFFVIILPALIGYPYGFLSTSVIGFIFAIFYAGALGRVRYIYQNQSKENIQS